MRRALLPAFMVSVLINSAAAAAAPGSPASGTNTPPLEGIVDLSDLAAVKAVCLATRPPDRVYFEGDAVAQGNAKEEYRTKRLAALGRLYRVRVPPEGFKLGEYQPRQDELTLDLSASPRALHGGLTLIFPSDTPVAFEVTASQAKDVSQAVKAGRAQLVAYFELDDDQGAVCTGSTAAQVFSIAAVPVAFELRDQQGSLARADTRRADQYRALIGGYSGAPEAVLGAIQGESPDTISIARHLTPSIETLKKCYADRLKTRADSGGTAVLGVSIKASGQVDSVTFIADGLGDDPLRECVETTFKGISFSGVQGLPTLFRVPVEFRLAQR